MLALRALPRERDELNVQRMLVVHEQGYWRFLPAPARDALRRGSKRMLRDGLDARRDAEPEVGVVLRAARHGATPATLAWLERVWRQDGDGARAGARGARLHRRSRRSWRCASVPAWQRDSRPAARADREPGSQGAVRVREARRCRPIQRVRDAFFESLRDVANRRREPWVLEGLSLPPSPAARGGVASRYIRPSLALLREIQRTGDIFFPKRWMDATLWGHSSASAAQMVRRSSRPFRRTIRSGCGGSSCRRPTICSARRRREAVTLDACCWRFARAATTHVEDADDADQDLLKLRTCYEPSWVKLGDASRVPIR